MNMRCPVVEFPLHGSASTNLRIRMPPLKSPQVKLNDITAGAGPLGSSMFGNGVFSSTVDKPNQKGVRQAPMN
jgi:hypothetical protein